MKLTFARFEWQRRNAETKKKEQKMSSPLRWGGGFVKWSHFSTKIKKKKIGTRARRSFASSARVRMLCCGQQMHPIKRLQASKDSAVNAAGQFETE